jgi:ParB family chromosome partitioning protein
MTIHNPYANKNRGKVKANALAAIQGQQSKMTLKSGKKVSFRTVEVPHADIEKKTFKSPTNKRSERHITIASVMDILPEIREQGRNAVPAYGVEHKDGRIEVLAGMRRRKSVMLTENGVFVILVAPADQVSIADRQSLTSTADTYEEPSVVDLGFSMLEMKRNSNEKLNQEKLAELFEVSTGRVSEAMSFAEKLPDDLYSLFPSLGAISHRFLRDCLKLYKEAEQAFRIQLDKAIRDGLRITVDEDTTKDDVKNATKQLEAKLLAFFKADKPVTEKASTNSVWDNKSLKKGASVKVAKTGAVTLKLDKNIDAATQKKILKLLQDA